MCHPHYTHGIHYYLSSHGSTCSPTLSCPTSPAVMGTRDLSALCPLKAQVHCTSPADLHFPLFLLSSWFLMNPPDYSFCFCKSPAIPSWWSPCPGSKLGLKVLCCPTFKYHYPQFDAHSHAMGSICFLFLLSITYACPAHFSSCCQDRICPPLSDCSIFYSHIRSLCAGITYLVPCQRHHFLPCLPSRCCRPFGSHLSEGSLGMGHT